MSRLRNLSFVFLFGWACLAPAQQVPQQKAPPFFQGEKKPKDDQSKSRSVSGVVKDEKDESATGAVVQLKDTKSLVVRSFITKEDGEYHFHGLSTDVEYTLKAERNNAASPVKTLTVFDSRKAAIINLKLEPKK